MAEQDIRRFDRLRKLCPRRFHISENHPFGVGLVLCCHVNEEDDEDGQQFFTQHDGIRNCKPGIWTSMRRPVTNVSQGDQRSEYILRWVGPGTIDISQPVEEWEAYEKATREADAAVKLSQIVPKGTKWRRAGSYFSDDGVCAIISTEYLTKEASETIMGEEAGTKDYGSYLELLTLNGTEAWETPVNAGFTIGGVDCEPNYLLLC